MDAKPTIGYALTFIVSPVVGFVLTKYVDPVLGVTVAGGIAGLGGRLLHLSDKPDGAAAEPAKP